MVVRRKSAAISFAVFFCVACLTVWSQAWASSLAPQFDHDRAVQMAREGRYDESLALLRTLYKQHGEDLSLVHDFLVVMSWAGGRDEAVVRLYENLVDPNPPAYVLTEVARALRNLHRPAEAAKIYRKILVRDSAHEAATVGLIHSLAEDGYVTQALAAAMADRERNGDRADVALAAAEEADQYGLFEAVPWYQLVLKIVPENNRAKLGLIRALNRLGASRLALKLAQDNPGLVPVDELRRFDGDVTATHIRWGELTAVNADDRYADTDIALRRLDTTIAQEKRQGREQGGEMQRARYDRLVALRDRSRMREAVTDYEMLQKEGKQIPPYVRRAAADAYLDIRQPEKARDLYREILRETPRDYGTRRQLFYAYVECDDFEQAFRVIDDFVRDTPLWISPKDGAPRRLNEDRANAALVAGAGRLYAGMVKEADRLLTPHLDAAPNTPAHREMRGNLYHAHGWPRAANEEYQIGLALAHGQDRGNEAGLARTAFDLQQFKTAGMRISSLARRFPENAEARRLARAWDVHNQAELQIRADYGQPLSTNSANPVRSYGTEARIYSPPFEETWRLFVGQVFAHQNEPNQEGSIGVSRSMLGLEYREGPWKAQMAPTYNLFHGTKKIGMEGEVSHSLNDQWSLALAGEKLTRATPLRAMNTGVTADFVGGRVSWQQDETRSIRLGGHVMPFSDDNLRAGADIDVAQRLYTAPHLKIDGLLATGLEQNSKDANRSYYNPSSVFVGLAGAQAWQSLYQRYEALWQHTLRVMSGIGHEQGYGENPIFQARYEHRFFWDETFDAGINVGFVRRAYDGESENDISMGIELRRRLGL